MISVIIVTYNSEEFIEQCLDSVIANTKGDDFEIIVIDNNSNDRTVEIVYRKYKHIRLIRNSKNIGFAAANNKGISRAKGEFIYFLNPDSIIVNSAISQMQEFLLKTPDAGAVGSRIEYFDGRLQLSCRKFPNFINVFFGRKSVFRSLFPRNPVSRQYMMEDIDYNIEQNVDWVMGASMMVRREMILKIGMFDEDYFLFVEDTDLCMRIFKNGLKTYYLPSARIRHYHGGSVRNRFSLSQMNHNISMYKYFKKYYFKNIFLKGCLYFAILIRLLSVGLMGFIIETVHVLNIPPLIRGSYFRRSI